MIEPVLPNQSHSLKPNETTGTAFSYSSEPDTITELTGTNTSSETEGTDGEDSPHTHQNSQAELSTWERVKHIFQGFGRVASTGYDDYKHDEHKVTAVAFASGTLITQAVDRARLVTIYGPQLATEVYSQTNNSLLGGLAIAGVFAFTNYSTGEVLTQSMDRFPSAKQEFRESFPKTVQIFSDSLAGVKTDEIVAPEELNDTDPRDSTDNHKKGEKLKKILLPVRRAMAGIGLGSTAFVATSSVNNHDTKEVRKVNLQVTRDTSVLIAAVATGILEGVETMYEQGWNDAAELADNVVSDGRTWYGVAAVSILWTYIANRRAAKKIDNNI